MKNPANHLKDFFLAHPLAQQKGILAAVSGGVDSMVLLQLLLAEKKEKDFRLAVVHVNHQLRAESGEEERALRIFCQAQAIPLFAVRWQADPAEVKRLGTESAARTFRYRFFAEVMQKEGYHYLLTAHHEQDLEETLLLKMIQGTSVAHLNIAPCQPFGTGELLRPLLGVSKTALYQYAAQHGLRYFEDATNQATLYRRNRLRLQVLPLLRKENPALGKSMTRLAESSQLAEELFEEWWQKHRRTEFPFSWWKKLSSAKQRYYLKRWLLEEAADFQPNYEQILQITQLLNGTKPQGEVRLNAALRLVRRYEAIAIKAISNEAPHENQCFSVQPNRWQKLSATEWFGFFTDPPRLSEKDGTVFEAPLYGTLPSEIELRHVRPGEVIAKKPGHYHKRIKKTFREHRLTIEERQNVWAAFTPQGACLWVIPWEKSYLSLPGETDKIMGKLLYICKK
ncbi:tRNA lysidine(34) synthetase TilS [Enterococcus hirae]|nr:tRNA lysidine(34) synthetase TilS [Enterococcus hirae]